MWISKVGRLGIGRSGIGDKWIRGTGWSDCDQNEVIVTVIKFLHGDHLISYTAFDRFLTRRSFDFLQALD